MCTTQISLEEKASFEDCDEPTPSVAVQPGSTSIPASSLLFLGGFWTPGHSRGSRVFLPSAGLLKWQKHAGLALAWPGHTQLPWSLRLCPLFSYSGVKPTPHSAETPACSCSFSTCFHRSFFPLNCLHTDFRSGIGFSEGPN